MKRKSLFLIILSISLISILSQGCDKGKGGETILPTESETSPGIQSLYGGRTYAVTSVSASVEPSVYFGPCPKTFIFTGRITMSVNQDNENDGRPTIIEPIAVTYRWEHSPGTGTPETIYFPRSPEGQPFTATATVTKEYTSDHDDYLALIIDAPNTQYNGEYLYALVDFSVTCTTGQLTRPPRPIEWPVPKR